MPGPRQIFLSFAVALLLLGEPAIGQPSAGQELMHAVDRGDIATMRRLLAASTPPDPADAAGNTPLLIAVAGNRLEAAELLIASGANVNAQAANGDSPWLLAGALGRARMLQLMIPKQPDLSLRNRFGGNALIPACERAHVEAVDVLLTTRIDVNHVNDLGWTCLLEIVLLGNGGPRHADVARKVLAAGADPNIADRDGVSPLQHARRRGQREIALIIETAGGR